MSNRYEFVNFLNAHDKFRDNDKGVKFDSFEAVRTLNHYWNLLNKQDQKIKELEHRLSNCIEPKFVVGQEIWFINNSKVVCGEIEEFEYVISKYKEGYYYSIDGYGWFLQKSLFVTEEDALKKLEELRNG